MTKEERREYMKAYRKKKSEDPEYLAKRRAKMREYFEKRKADPEYYLKYIKRQKEWRKAHPDYMANYLKEHPEKIESYNLAWAKNSSDPFSKLLKKMRDWEEADHDN